jgi:CelD/BcsL family acetyltransferase involved in cellulose biosynthesis
MTLASDVIRPCDLDEDCLRQWESIRRGQPSLSGPYFTPQFVAIVGKVRPRTRIAVIRDAGTTIGFFPFEIGRMRQGHPVARSLSDFHGPILSQDCDLDATALLRLSGLRAWTFDHLVASDDVFRASATSDCDSPTIDLSDGVEAYFSERHQAERRHFKQLDYCSRRIIRDYPDIEYTMESKDSAALRQLMEWKSEQCRRSELPDVFGVEWTRSLLELILAEDDENFAG